MIATTGLSGLHLPLGPLSGPHAVAVRDADAAGVLTLAVTTTPRAWPRNHELAQRTKRVRAALGLHPSWSQSARTKSSYGTGIFQRLAMSASVGLDAGPQFFKSLDAQKRVFSTCCNVARRRWQDHHDPQH